MKLRDLKLTLRWTKAISETDRMPLRDVNIGTPHQYHGLTLVGVNSDVIVGYELAFLSKGFTLDQAGFKSFVHRTLADIASGCHVSQSIIE